MIGQGRKDWDSPTPKSAVSLGDSCCGIDYQAGKGNHLVSLLQT